MFKRFTNGCVSLVNRWLPDPFLFAIILTIVVYILVDGITTLELQASHLSKW